MRYFGASHRLMWAEASVPVGGLTGSITGTGIQGFITGAGDSSYQVAMLLKGGPALSVMQFENYKPTTILGASCTITAPTGQYNPVKILNLGSERWYFKPELALSHPFGTEAEAAARGIYQQLLLHQQHLIPWSGDPAATAAARS